VQDETDIVAEDIASDNMSTMLDRNKAKNNYYICNKKIFETYFKYTL
jgi:hypothetical protein